MESLHLSLIQFNIAWENPTLNIHKLTQTIRTLKGNTHIAMLPEMFSTGFSMNPKSMAENENGPSLRWMKEMANECHIALCGSIMFENQEFYYNRFFFVEPNGTIYKYDKRHLFRMMDEHQHYRAGTQRVVFSYLGWRIMPQICYDLRFPVWSRNRNDYDLLIYVANFPAARQTAWDKLLPARAIENSCYVAAVNRTGTDGNNIPFSGHSQVIDYKGQCLTECNNESETVISASLSMNELKEYREKFPSHLDSDSFTIHF